MTLALSPVNLSEIQWVNAVELQTHPDGAIQPWRLPLEMLDFLEDRTRFQAGNPSGVRLRFSSNTTRVVLEVAPDEKLERYFDLLADDQLHDRITLEPGQTTIAFKPLNSSVKTLELWLNHMYAPVLVRSLSLDHGASLAPAPKQNKKRILFYGSSISHGRKADGPTESCTVGAARIIGLDPLNYGLGGACTMEPAVAMFLRDTPADYLSFCLGINVQAGITHSLRTFRSGIAGLIRIVREKHVRTPLAVQSPIYCDGPAETTPNKLGMDLTICRQIIAEVVATFQKHGDRHIIYTDGLELWTPAQASLMFDGLHPDGAGHRLLSQRYAEIVWPKLQALGE